MNDCKLKYGKLESAAVIKTSLITPLSNKANRHFYSVLSLWAVCLLLSTLLLGCFHDKDKPEQDEEQATATTIAPTASFTQASTSGKAPLTLTFTDSSSNGSANISQWAWTFGDGGTSSEQHPQYIYNTAGVFDVSLTVTSNDGSHAITQTSAVSVIPADVQVTMTVISTKGLPLDGITASSAVFQIEDQTTNNHTQLVVSMRPTALQGIVRLKKEGYADALVFIDGAEFGNIKSIAMLKLDPAIVFDGSFGGEFFGRDGASVKLPEAALLKPDGSAVQGPVQLYITPIDVIDAIEGQAFPGSFIGLPDEDDIPVGGPLAHQIISYGVTQFSFYQAGEELQLREGQIADLILPLYTKKNLYGDDIQIGESIPMWILNEETGIWKQEGAGSVVANYTAKSGLGLSAQTSHFSSFNADAWGGFGDSGLGGSGGGKGFCPFTADFIGAELLVPIHYTLELLLIRSKRESMIIDNTLSGYIPRGTAVKLSANQGDDKYGEATFGCKESDEVIEVQITFGEAKPEFREWNFTSKPVFTLSPVDSKYEILTNLVTVGGRFVGTQTVDIQTELLNAEILGLPNLQFMELEYDVNLHASPTVFTATLTNDVGSTERVTEVNYIERMSPIVDFFSSNEVDSTIDYVWDVKGADEGAVYYLGDDVTALGSLIFRIEDVEGGLIQNNQLIGLNGFIRVEFSNRYGSSVIIGRLKQFECSLLDDLPCYF